MRLALFQPDIAQNTGALLRVCSCFGVPLDIIEPCGFVFDDRKLKRVGMDYVANVEVKRYLSWRHFMDERNCCRLVLLSTKASSSYLDFDFMQGDTLLLGRESAGVPEEVAQACDAMVKIPMHPGARSFNVAVSGAIVLSEGLRQLQLL